MTALNPSTTKPEDVFYTGIGNPETAQPILMPDDILERLDNGADLVISVSGGKDSDVMALALNKLHKARGWTGQLILVHADLGRMEWKESLPHCYDLADKLDTRLAVVRKTTKIGGVERDFDLLMGFRRRMYKLMDVDGVVTAPPFSSSAARYCTSDWKRAPIDKFLRNEPRWRTDADVIVAIGLRRDESTARSKKATVQERKGASAPSKNRRVTNWHPILHWTMDDINAICDEFDWELHVAYSLGNERVSCQMCVLACSGDITNGVYRNPKLYRQIVNIELRAGFAFQQHKPLWRVAPELLTQAQRDKAEELEVVLKERKAQVEAEKQAKKEAKKKAKLKAQAKLYIDNK